MTSTIARLCNRMQTSPSGALRAPSGPRGGHRPYCTVSATLFQSCVWSSGGNRPYFAPATVKLAFMPIAPCGVHS